MTFERRCRLLQFCSERCQFGKLVLGGSDLAGDELAQLVLDWTALAAIPRCGQARDLIEGAAELLGASDERQPVDDAWSYTRYPAGVRDAFGSKPICS